MSANRLDPIGNIRIYWGAGAGRVRARALMLDNTPASVDRAESRAVRRSEVAVQVADAVQAEFSLGVTRKGGLSSVKPPGSYRPTISGNYPRDNQSLSHSGT